MVIKDISDFDTQNYYSLISEKTKDFVGRSNWLYPQIRDWISDPNGSRYFLITGKAGTGKSAIAARLWEISEGIIKDSYLQKDFITAIHVCSARENESIDHRIFSKSFSRQLVNNVDGFAEELIKSSSDGGIKNINLSSKINEVTANIVTGIDIENLNIGQISPNVLFNKLVREPLNNIIQTNSDKKIVFLIDALDESITRFDSDSIKSLITNIQTLSSNVRFIITTRDNEEIVESFLKDGKIISLSEKYFENNKCDIFEYVELRLTKDNILKRHYDGFIHDLNLKAQGNFLYIDFLFDAIVECRMELTKESLDIIPPFLDGLYYEFLNRIKVKDEQLWNNALKPILDTLSISFGGLNVSEISLLCGLSPSEVTKSLSILSSFIKHLESANHHLDSDNLRYNLYHQSLVDFFRKQKYSVRNQEGQEYAQRNLFYIRRRSSSKNS